MVEVQIRCSQMKNSQIKDATLDQLNQYLEHLSESVCDSITIIHPMRRMILSATSQSRWYVYFLFYDQQFAEDGYLHDTSLLDDPTEISITLDNGQVDEYPISHSIDLPEGKQVARTFFQTGTLPKNATIGRYT